MPVDGRTGIRSRNRIQIRQIITDPTNPDPGGSKITDPDLDPERC